MYLSVGFPLRDLAERFSIHRTTASRIISTWTHFTVLPAGKPAPLDSSRDSESSPARWVCSFSWYTGDPWLYRAILSDAILSAPSEWVFLYLQIAHYIQGHDWHGTPRCCHREIFKLSGIVKLLKPGMAIMVDKGFVVDNLAPCKVYRPAFLSNKRQMSREDVIQTQSIARLRVHVERCIRRVKENKLFDKDIPLSTCGNIDELFSVACFLVNYQNGPLVKAWATQQWIKHYLVS